MPLSKFPRLDREEHERAKVDALRGMAVWRVKRDPRLLLRTIYGLENQEIGGFLNTGSLDAAIFGMRHPCIVTLFPFPDEDHLRLAYGVDARRLDSLVAEGHVIPLVQTPSRYEKLDYAHSIFRHRPRDYFLRSVYFYAIFFDDTTDLVRNGGLYLAPTLNDLYERAKQNAVLDTILRDENSGVREYYDRLPFPNNADKLRRIRENIWYRYASVAAFLGEEITDYILNAYPAKRALAVLLDLHFMFDHAWTQGLLANMHNEVSGHTADWLSAWLPTEFWWKNALSRLLFTDIAVPSLKEPTLSQLETARIDGGLDPCGSVREDGNLNNLEELRAKLKFRIAEIEAKVDRIAERGQKIVWYRTIASLLLGGAGALVSPDKPAGVAIGLASGALLPEAVLKGISDFRQRFGTEHNVDTHIVAYLSNTWSQRPLLRDTGAKELPRTY
jgi:hypothetical protein